MPLISDTEIYINHLSDKGKGDKLITRLRFNTAFLAAGQNQKQFVLKQLDPVQNHTADEYSGFSVTIHYSEACSDKTCAATMDISKMMTEQQL